MLLRKCSEEMREKEKARRTLFNSKIDGYFSIKEMLSFLISN